MSYRGSPILNSDLSDLMVDILQKTSTNFSPGWKELASSLKELNVPKELVPNEKIWKFMNMKKRDIENDIMTYSKHKNKHTRKKFKINWESYDVDDDDE